MTKKDEQVKACPECGCKEVKFPLEYYGLHGIQKNEIVFLACNNDDCPQGYSWNPRTGRITAKSKIPPRAGK